MIRQKISRVERYGPLQSRLLFAWLVGLMSLSQGSFKISHIHGAGSIWLPGNGVSLDQQKLVSIWQRLA